MNIDNTSQKHITTISGVDALNEAEVVEGYRTGLVDNSQPGGNHSVSYVHGWRCGQYDRGVLPIPQAHRDLTRMIVQRSRREIEKGRNA